MRGLLRNAYEDGSLAEPFLPQETSDLQRAFPAQVRPLMPPAEAIPEDLGDWSGFCSHWMFKGWTNQAQFVPSELLIEHGIRAEVAFYHLYCIARSFEPRHEYKDATIGFLASLWFTGVRDEGLLLFGQWPDFEDETDVGSDSNPSDTATDTAAKA